MNRNLTLYVQPELYKALKKRVSHEGVSLSAYCANVLTQHLEQEAERHAVDILFPEIVRTIQTEVGHMSNRLAPLFARTALDIYAARSYQVQMSMLLGVPEDTAKHLNQASFSEALDVLKRKSKEVDEVALQVQYLEKRSSLS